MSQNIAYSVVDIGNHSSREDANKKVPVGPSMLGILSVWMSFPMNPLSGLKLVRDLHKERLDWESALYVLTRIITQYENGEGKHMNVLQERSMTKMIPMRNWHIFITSTKGLI